MSTPSLDDVIRNINEHLAETDAPYRAYVGAQLGLAIEDDETALEDINQALHDSGPEQILAIANDCLTGRYELEGETVVFTHPDEESVARP